MPEYRAYAVGEDGHFSGYEPLVCANDEGHREGPASFTAPWRGALERT
jgi:hypothetical protein